MYGSGVILILSGCGDETILENKSELALLKLELEELRTELQESEIKVSELQLQLEFAREDISYLQQSANSEEQPQESALVLQHSEQIDELEAQVQTNAGSIAQLSSTMDIVFASGIIELGNYLVVDTSEHLISFSGANVSVDNGASSTQTLNGLGNVIIGYNLSDSDVRTGSHNLIVGDRHSYSSSSSIVSGNNHRASGGSVALLGGSNNVVSADFGVVAGGESSSVASDGHHFIGGGFGAQINGGEHNATLGGVDPTIESGSYSLVIGGESNTIESSYDSVVVGGDGNSVVSFDYVSFFGQMSADAAFDEEVASQ